MTKYLIELDDDDTTTNVGSPFEITDEARRLANRPYRIAIWRDEDGYWCGEIPELPGHIASGETFEEMIALAEDAKLTWIAVRLDEGRSVPDPVPVPVVSIEPDDRLFVDLAALAQAAHIGVQPPIQDAAAS